MEQKTLILSLITDDLIHQKMLNNLLDMGIDASDYHLNLGSTVFQLMGIDRPADDPYFDDYMTLAEKSKYLSFNDGRKPFQALAEEIYTYLDALRP